MVGPPSDLPGLDPRWSRQIDVEDADGGCHTWHVLDNGATPEQGTMLCVHGNPTWSYLWRRFLAEAPPGWRVIAVDQLGMGFSDRTAEPRRFAARVADLDAVTRALGVTGPLVIVGHDWGGVISVAWALRHRRTRSDGNSPDGIAPNGIAPEGIAPDGIVLRGIVLANTALRQAVDAPVPPLIRLARSPALRRASCAATPLFVAATAATSRPPLPADVRAALRAPYHGAQRRQAVDDFVADIPLEADHPSRAPFDAMTQRLGELADVPTLVLWGARDPVFTDRYRRDLLRDLPHAQLHRYPNAGHLVTEDVPEAARTVWSWVTAAQAAPSTTLQQGTPAPIQPEQGTPAPILSQQGTPAPIQSQQGTPAPTQPQQGTPAPIPSRPVWAELDARADDPALAVVEQGARGRRVSFGLLHRRVHELAAGLAASGVEPGHRVALLVPPGADLIAAVYACWQVGAVIVVADAGLGPRGLAAALRGADPDHVIGIPQGLLLAKALGVPGQRIVAGRASALTRRLIDARHSLVELAERGRALPPPLPPAPDAESAVVFTSGATGPAKGVVYRHRQVRAQLDILREAFALTRDDRLVAAFPPFAIYGPALGIASVVPDIDAPGQLTAVALAEAAAAADATVVFASPAALRGVVATADELRSSHREALRRVRLVVSAGAPVPAALLHALRDVLPVAEMHTPYGMTEALPVTDVTLAEIDAAGTGNGVCVGMPLPGVDVRVSPLAADGASTGPLTDQPGGTGEICVRGPHVKDRYDGLWATEQASTRDPGRHRTGDVGHLDEQGRLWVEGRLGHVVTHASGPVTPVGIEQRVQRLVGVDAAAVVGVGPRGTQQVVVVVTPSGRVTPPSVLAPPPLAAAVRAAAADGGDAAATTTTNAAGTAGTAGAVGSTGTVGSTHVDDAGAASTLGGVGSVGAAGVVSAVGSTHVDDAHGRAGAVGSVGAAGVVSAVGSTHVDDAHGRAGAVGSVVADCPTSEAGPINVAAVLVTDRLPVDIRHASKIDRARVAAWAERVLAGERAGPRP